MTDRLLSRKFILVLLAQLANVLLCWFSKIDAGVFATVSAFTIGGYITGNVVQKATAKETANGGSTTP